MAEPTPAARYPLVALAEWTRHDTLGHGLRIVQLTFDRGTAPPELAELWLAPTGGECVRADWHTYLDLFAAAPALYQACAAAEALLGLCITTQPQDAARLTTVPDPAATLALLRRALAQAEGRDG